LEPRTTDGKKRGGGGISGDLSLKKKKGKGRNKKGKSKYTRRITHT